MLELKLPGNTVLQISTSGNEPLLGIILWPLRYHTREGVESLIQYLASPHVVFVSRPLPKCYISYISMHGHDKGTALISISSAVFI